MANSISLQEFVRQVKEGVTIKETMTDGRKVEFVLHSPKQGVAYEIQKVLQDVMSGSGEMVGDQLELRMTDPGVLLRLQELDSRCLVACCPEIDADSVMGVLDLLPENSKVLTRAKALCGADMGEMAMEEDDAGKPTGDGSPG